MSSVTYGSCSSKGSTLLLPHKQRSQPACSANKQTSALATRRLGRTQDGRRGQKPGSCWGLLLVLGSLGEALKLFIVSIRTATSTNVLGNLSLGIPRLRAPCALGSPPAMERGGKRPAFLPHPRFYRTESAKGAGRAVRLVASWRAWGGGAAAGGNRPKQPPLWGVCWGCLGPIQARA